jgi:hypothetical protein
MADEQQETLKKKIQILFQLGKWPDVIKLCESYAEKYGKEAEIEQIRFKCERHLGIARPEPKPAAKETAVGAEEAVGPQPPLGVHVETPDPSIPLIPPTRADELGPDEGERFSFDVQPAIHEVDIGEPFAETELAFEDPFVGEEPGLRLAPDENPVVIPDQAPAAAEPSFPPADLEAALPRVADELANDESEPDFANMGALTIDAEPELIATAAPAKAAAVPEMPAPVFRMEAPAAAEEPFRPATGHLEALEERPAETKPPASRFVEEEERPRPRGSMFTPPAAKEEPEEKKPFNIKLALLIVVPLLLAAGLSLALSAKLDFSGNETAPAAEPAVDRPVPRRPRPAKPAASPAAAAQAAAQKAAEEEKAFNDKFKLAEELSRKGDLLNAWAALLEAKKIKQTEPLIALEQQLSQKMREAQEAAKKAAEIPKSEYDREVEAMTQAKAADTIAAWQDFLRAFPQGQMAAQAERRIAVLEKKAQEEAERQLRQRIQQAQNLRLRSEPLNLSQADVAAQTGASGRSPSRFETMTRGGATVTLDLAAGLMWTLYNKPMAYDKAQWWANRVAAGYSGWRLPTVDEALTLLQMERSQYARLADFAVWTCDGVSTQPRACWVLRLPAGQFTVAPFSQLAYVWAVRKAGK